MDQNLKVNAITINKLNIGKKQFLPNNLLIIYNWINKYSRYKGFVFICYIIINKELFNFIVV